MKLKLELNKKTVTAAIIVFAVIAALFTFYIRPPVLIVTEQSFIDIYGKERIQNEAFSSAFAMFRPVKIVTVANDAGEDVVPFTVSSAAIRPFCVIFPLRFVKSAVLYRELAPNIPIVVLEGRYLEEENPSGSVLGEKISEYFVFKTDINDDFYRIGLAVTTIKLKSGQKHENFALDEGKKGRVALFLDYKINKMKDVFLRGLYDNGELFETLFYNSYSQYMELPELSCAVMVGTGADFMEKKNDVPVISFTWIDPSLLPFNVAMIVNDSPLAQVRQAVKMVKSGVKKGLIKSEFRVLDRSKFDRKLIAIIKKNR